MKKVRRTSPRRLLRAETAALLLLAIASGAWYEPKGIRASEAALPKIPSAALAVSPEAAKSLEEKMRALSTPVPPATRSLQPIAITEVEANSYLKYRGAQFLPPAVHDPELHITSEHVAGVADIDFNQLNQGSAGAQKTSQPGDWATRALAGIFTGKQRVAATGKLETGNGQGRVKIESVSIGTVTVPPVLVDWILENYLQKQYNIDLSKPFALPDHVTHIELGAGRAVFVRSPGKGR